MFGFYLEHNKRYFYFYPGQESFKSVKCNDDIISYFFLKKILPEKKVKENKQKTSNLQKNRGFYLFTQTVFYNSYFSVIIVTILKIQGTSYIITTQFLYLKGSHHMRAFYFSKLTYCKQWFTTNNFFRKTIKIYGKKFNKSNPHEPLLETKLNFVT